MAKCQKCRKRFAEEGHRLCSACEFVPKKGIIPPGMSIHRTRPVTSGEPAEDDYSENSTADSIHIEQNDRQTRFRKAP